MTLLLWAALSSAQPVEPAPPSEPAPLEQPAVAEIPEAESAVTPLPEQFGPPGPPIAGEALEAALTRTSLGLRCPTCQGLSVNDSPATSARTMKKRIHDLLALGYSQEQIEAYFVSRYGEWVLLEPPARGATWALWVLPGAGFGAVFAWAIAVGLRWKEEDAIEGPTEDHLVPRDAFEQRILEEIE